MSPRSLGNQGKFHKFRIFRDETELPTSSNLSNDIKAALEQSEYSIVICSASTAKSRWCMEEIQYFKALHNGSNANIITVVADGKPEETFPDELYHELVPVTQEDGSIIYEERTIEPRASDVASNSLSKSFRKLKCEYLRVAAPLTGCEYNNLYNRQQRKKSARLFLSAVS